VLRHTQKQVCSYKKADWEHLKCLLQRVNFADCVLWYNINYNWLSWKDFLFPAIDECIPKIKVRRRQHAPWIRKELLCRRKKILYKKAKRTNKTSVWTKYRELNYLLKRKCNEAR
jgi:hypothetical protein